MALLTTIPDSILPQRAFASDDCIEILRFAADSFDSGHACALVTLVDIRGGAARPLGAQMAVRDDAVYCGYVSGGCTETAIAAEAVNVISNGIDRYLRLGEGSRFFDIVLPCGGGISVSIHVLRKSDGLRSVLHNLDKRNRTALKYDPGAQSITHTRFSGKSGWADKCFSVAYFPRPRIVVVGDSIEADTTAQLAAASGYEICRITPDNERQVIANLIDADTAVAILHHDLERELPALTAALDATPFYIGALGSSRTHEKRVVTLKSQGYRDFDIARIKAPIGIFEKARDANSLALSVLADIAAARPNA